ncbi:type 1 glutamine amidotransferase domain-containing protein [Actinoplanes sp. NPDC051851]|uniref:type 1 glutamine amidotransferase domain-containing protein n=1 Tax=Actinoplanes sp. NPDC051851 TaxID=3154753 RepID=UPI003415E6D9
MTKVLFAVSEWGYWGEELVGPLEACDQAGYEVEFVTPTGARPTPLSVSMDPGYVDPPQGRSVTSPEMAAKTRALHESDRLDKPHDLGGWVPARPYPSSPAFLRDCEEYYRRVERVVDADLRAYGALVIVGGSGAMVDLANNQRLHELILGFVRLDRPVAAVCYGVAALAFARDPLRKLSILRGRRVTGHPIDYDYHDGTGFEGPKAPAGVDFGPPFYPLEFILRDAVGPDGEFIGNVGHAESVIVDHPFITARSTESSVGCGRALVDVLDHGVRRYGW